ncbi:UNVERIFIED_CONTAM: hypothetical protein FKN15_075162 [Acipenser sinensis]
MEETDREAIATAIQRVAGMLQRPDQLDKVEQYRRREARKKASVEARLKVCNPLIDTVLHPIVPEIVQEAHNLIERAELLQAHRKLMDLECSRDDLMYEQYRMDVKNTHDMNLIRNYFGEVQNLSEELAKQLWMVLQRSMLTVRRDPTMVVSVVRIIEREEKIDRRMLDRKKQTAFIPPGRPKKWKEKMFEVLEGTVSTRIEGSQSDTRESDKMWLVRLLEITRKYVQDDLIVVKNLMIQCFPPNYDILNKFFTLYHKALSVRIEELASEDLEANEIVSLLTWVLNTYKSAEMMGHPELTTEMDVNSMGPLLPKEVVDQLLSKYIQIFTSNITGWLRKALETDKKDWKKDTEPEADQDGYYQTTLPAIVFQMFEQNLQVAAQIDEIFKQEFANGISFFFIFDRESIRSLKKKYSKTEFDESDAAIDSTLDSVAKDGCVYLLDEVFMDLEQHLNELMTRKWLTGSNAVDTICVTIEDYFNDFAKIKKPYNKEMTFDAHRRVVIEYIKAVMQKRISFKNPDERKEGAERMIKEAEQLKFLFRKLSAGLGEDTDRLCDTIVALAEVFKLTDPTLLYLEVSTLVSKYPDIREDHVLALLAVRGDANREMKQMIIETLNQNKPLSTVNTQPVFRDIVVPTMTVNKLLK